MDSLVFCTQCNNCASVEQTNQLAPGLVELKLECGHRLTKES